MSEAMMGFAGLAVLVAAVFALDLLLSGRQRRRIARGGRYRGVRDQHGTQGAANEAGVASRANGLSGSTYLG